METSLLGTASIDTICTIWGLEVSRIAHCCGSLYVLTLQTGQVLGQISSVSGTVRAQLIAHDKEVYDITFSRAGGGRDMFAIVGNKFAAPVSRFAVTLSIPRC